MGGLGCIDVGRMVLFLTPRKALLDSSLTADSLLVDNPLFINTLSIYMGLAVWLALWLRDKSVRSVVRLKQRATEAAALCGLI